MMLNTTGEVFAQSVSLDELKRQHNKELEVVLKKHWEEMRTDKRLQDTRWAQYSFDQANKQEADFKANGDIFYNAILKDPVLRRAEEISYIIFGKGQTEDKTPAPVSKQEFANQYLATLKTQNADALNKLAAEQEKQLRVINGMEEGYLAMGQYDEQAVKTWKAQSVEGLEKWTQDTKAKLAAVYKKEVAQTSDKYNNYLADYKTARKEAEQKSFLIIKKLANELIALYNKNPKKIKDYILKITPMLSVIRINGQKVFSDAQEHFLLNLYKETLQEKENYCFKNIGCDSQINAMLGIGTLGQYQEDALPIAEFMNKTRSNREAVRILISGVGALLAMKQYDTLRSFLYENLKQENDFSSVDLLSLSTPVEAFATIRGKYLGESSKYYQYEMEDDSVRNAWTDVALMLADEGSEDSLNLLRTFGIEQCRVYIEKQVNLKDKYSMFCGGIKPFLTGALLSGQSGAEQYSIRAAREGEAQLLASGRGRIITKEEAQRQASAARAGLINFDAFAKQDGLSREALVAREIINSGMGDINTKAEKTLDKELYSKFQNVISCNQLGSYAVVDDARISTKLSREIRTQSAMVFASIADVGITLWCLWDLSRLAYKGLRGISKLGNQIWKGVRVARMGSEAERAVYLRGHIDVFRQIRAREVAFVKYTDKFKNALEPVVMSQRALYTSAPLPSAALINAEKTNTFASALKTASFDVAEGAYVINVKAAYQESYGQPERVLNLQKTKELLNASAKEASVTYQQRTFLEKYKSYKSILSKTLEKNISSAEYLSPYQKQQGFAWAEMVKYDRNIRFNKEAAFVVPKIEEIKLISARPEGMAKDVKNMELFYDDGTGVGSPLPVEVSIDGKIPGIKTKDLSGLLLQKKEDNIWLKFVNGENKLIDPSFFKIGIKQESMPSIIKAARTTELENQLVLKFLPEEKGFTNFFTSTVPDFFKTKADLWSGKGYVMVRDGSKFRKTNVHLQTTGRYDGVRAILEPNGTFTFMGKNKNLLLEEYSFSLPKNQINTFMKILPAIDFAKPVHLSLLGGRNKINSLFFVTAISLSAASTGLVGPLQKNYGKDITPEGIYMISVILPYAASLLSPAISPFVKKFGALNVLKTSMGTALVSLSVPVFFGFNGFGGISADNPNKPSIAPLLISAGLIGISASLTRSSFNPLMNAVGGGGNLLKSMAFKNLSSYALILPPFLSAGADWLWPRYMKNGDGSIKLNDKGEKVAKPWTDFSLAYPVLAGITGTSLFFLQRARLSSTIGKVESYAFSKGMPGITRTSWVGRYAPTFAKGFNSVWKPHVGVLAETFGSVGSMGNKAVLPIVLGSTAVLGAEGALVNSYSMGEANNYVYDKITKEKAVMPIIATTALCVAPFLVRLKSKQILEFMGGEKNPAAYKKLLFTSLGVAGLGGYTLSQQDNIYSFSLGMALTAAGFASTTNTFLKIGRYNLEAAGAAKSLITRFDVVYPGVHIGMAFVPKIYGNAVTNNVEALGLSNQAEKEAATREEHKASMWIPLSALATGGLFALKGTGMLPTSSTIAQWLGKVPAGSYVGGKLLLGGQNYFNPTPAVNAIYNLGGTIPAFKYNLLDDFKAPSAVPFMKSGLSNSVKAEPASEVQELKAEEKTEDSK